MALSILTRDGLVQACEIKPTKQVDFITRRPATSHCSISKNKMPGNIVFVVSVVSYFFNQNLNID